MGHGYHEFVKNLENANFSMVGQTLFFFIFRKYFCGAFWQCETMPQCFEAYGTFGIFKNYFEACSYFYWNFLQMRDLNDIKSDQKL